MAQLGVMALPLSPLTVSQPQVLTVLSELYKTALSELTQETLPDKRESTLLKFSPSTHNSVLLPFFFFYQQFVFLLLFSVDFVLRL